MDYLEQRRKLRQMVQERLDYGRDYTDEEVEDTIDEVLMEQESLELCPVELRRRLRKELFDSLRRLDILQIFVEDSSVTEIMINGMDHIFVEQDGQLRELDRAFDSVEKLQDVIQQIVAGCNRVVNEASPIVDARLNNGSRVNIVMNPIALNGPIVTIRRFPDKPVTMQKLIGLETISLEAAQFLETLVKAGYNIFVSGGTGSGKTTFLNVLSGYISAEERVITIEDSAELQLQGLPNLVRLETRNGNTEGCREIGIRELIRSSLRMRPDRIIVGEVRGPEAIDMLQCKDLILLSPTGSGKTLAYLLPLVQSLKPGITGVQAIVLVPSRELALQIDQVFKSMNTPFKAVSCYGGRPAMEEHRTIKGVQPSVIIGTPGRMNDHLSKQNFDADTVTTLVIDEFDKCLEFGFQEEMATVIGQLPNLQRRFLLSATDAEEIPQFTGLDKTIKLNFLNPEEQLTHRLHLYKVLSPEKDKLETLYKLLCTLDSRPAKLR